MSSVIHVDRRLSRNRTPARCFDGVQKGSQHLLRVAIENLAGVVDVVLAQQLVAGQQQAAPSNGGAEGGGRRLPVRERLHLGAGQLHQRPLGSRCAEQAQHGGGLGRQRRCAQGLLRSARPAAVVRRSRTSPAPPPAGSARRVRTDACRIRSSGNTCLRPAAANRRRVSKATSSCVCGGARAKVSGSVFANHCGRLLIDVANHQADRQIGRPRIAPQDLDKLAITRAVNRVVDQAPDCNRDS